MPIQPERLRPATPDEIAQALSFALQFDGRKRVHHADSFMAQITATRLVEYLKLAGFVVMKKPPAPGHSASAHVPER